MDESGDQTAQNPEVEVDLVDATIDTGGMEWSGVGSGYSYISDIADSVSICLTQHNDDGDSGVGVTIYLPPEEAQQFATAIRKGEAGKFQSKECRMWLDRGWLHHEGPPRDQDGHSATATVAPDAAGSDIAFVYDASEDGDWIGTSAVLESKTAAEIADRIGDAAEHASEHEPNTPKTSEPSDGGSKLQRFVRHAIPTGITLGIAYFVVEAVNSAVADGGLSINGEPVTMVDPLTVVTIIGFTLFILMALPYLPGKVLRGR